jgi:hypothetical protein
MLLVIRIIIYVASYSCFIQIPLQLLYVLIDYVSPEHLLSFPHLLLTHSLLHMFLWTYVLALRLVTFFIF